uniref:Uncharacterized protein n=1 Tax=Steinernema glaseri TaxID=37863 RepID=A0A1I7YCN0_9BILA
MNGICGSSKLLQRSLYVVCHSYPFTVRNPPPRRASLSPSVVFGHKIGQEESPSNCAPVEDNEMSNAAHWDRLP